MLITCKWTQYHCTCLISIKFRTFWSLFKYIEALINWKMLTEYHDLGCKPTEWWTCIFSVNFKMRIAHFSPLAPTHSATIFDCQTCHTKDWSLTCFYLERVHIASMIQLFSEQRAVVVLLSLVQNVRVSMLLYHEFTGFQVSTFSCIVDALL